MQKSVTLSEEVLLTSKYFNVTKKTFERDGRKYTREFVMRHPIVLVIPYTADGKIILEKQYRDAYGKVLTEVVAGHIEDKDDPLVSAQRELQEETGLTAKQWTKIGIFELASNSRQTIHIFAATALTAGEKHLEDDEQIEEVRYTMEEVMEKIDAGEIVVTSHIAALMLFERKRKKGEL